MRQLKNENIDPTNNGGECWKVDGQWGGFGAGRPDSLYAVSKIECTTCGSDRFQVGVDMGYVVVKCTTCEWEKEVG